MTNLSYLATDMEVNQTEAVAHTLLVEEFERLQEFGAGESKLTSISPTFLPFATTGRSQFDTNTEIRPDIQFFCNFSLFQSLPDSWAIDQLFPIMPIERLNEKPTRNCTLQDITCDSDGKITNFTTACSLSFLCQYPTCYLLRCYRYLPWRRYLCQALFCPQMLCKIIHIA